MQNKTDKRTSLVSKSLPVANSNSVNRLFSARNKKYYDSCSETYAIGMPLPNVVMGRIYKTFGHAGISATP